MVATTKRAKVRTTDPRTGKFVWAYPEEPAPVDVRRQAVADLSAGDLYDWDGNEVEEMDETYDEYVNAMPPKADLRTYAKPVSYWEVRYPGCSLQPFPRMGALRSTDSGLWQANNAVQERAIREHILLSARVDPDTLKISDHEMRVMDGREPGSIRYCQAAGCRFVSCAMPAIDRHESLTGHRTDRTPRKDA